MQCLRHCECYPAPPSTPLCTSAQAPCPFFHSFVAILSTIQPARQESRPVDHSSRSQIRGRPAAPQRQPVLLPLAARDAWHGRPCGPPPQLVSMCSWLWHRLQRPGVPGAAQFCSLCCGCAPKAPRAHRCRRCGRRRPRCRGGPSPPPLASFCWLWISRCCCQANSALPHGKLSGGPRCHAAWRAAARRSRRYRVSMWLDAAGQSCSLEPTSKTLSHRLHGGAAASRSQAAPDVEPAMAEPAGVAQHIRAL